METSMLYLPYQSTEQRVRVGGHGVSEEKTQQGLAHQNTSEDRVALRVQTGSFLGNAQAYFVGLYFAAANAVAYI